jgi:hypothetical protein
LVTQCVWASLLTLPRTVTTDAASAVAYGMYFRMAGGYVGAYTPAAFARWPIVQMFYAGKPSQGYENSLTAFCGTHEVSAIILADDSAKEWDLPLHKIG